MLFFEGLITGIVLGFGIQMLYQQYDFNLLSFLNSMSFEKNNTKPKLHVPFDAYELIHSPDAVKNHFNYNAFNPELSVTSPYQNDQDDPMFWWIEEPASDSKPSNSVPFKKGA